MFDPSQSINEPKLLPSRGKRAMIGANLYYAFRRDESLTAPGGDSDA